MKLEGFVHLRLGHLGFAQITTNEDSLRWGKAKKEKGTAYSLIVRCGCDSGRFHVVTMQRDTILNNEERGETAGSTISLRLWSASF